MKAQVVIPIIIVMLIIAIPNSVYAMEFIDLPPASKKSLAEIIEEQRKIIEYGNLRAEFRPLYTVADSPALHVVPPGGTLDGVGEITIVRTDFIGACSGDKWNACAYSSTLFYRWSWELYYDSS